MPPAKSRPHLNHTRETAQWRDEPLSTLFDMAAVKATWRQRGLQIVEVGVWPACSLRRRACPAQGNEGGWVGGVNGIRALSGASAQALKPEWPPRATFCLPCLPLHRRTARPRWTPGAAAPLPPWTTRAATSPSRASGSCARRWARWSAWPWMRCRRRGSSTARRPAWCWMRRACFTRFKPTGGWGAGLWGAACPSHRACLPAACRVLQRLRLAADPERPPPTHTAPTLAAPAT